MTDDTEPELELEPELPLEAETSQPAARTPVSAPRRRRLTTAAVASLPDPQPEVPTRPYVVVGGPISPKGGVGNLVNDGEVVYLTDEQARHYRALGRLAPHIEGD